MLKLWGCALILAGGFMVRQRVVGALRREITVLGALCSMLEEMERAVRLELTPVPRLLPHLRAGAPAADFLAAVAAGLAAEQSLGEAWQAGARQLPLSEEAACAFSTLGGQLSGDEEGVCRALMRCRETLAAHLSAGQARRREREKLCTALCFSAGALLVIVLI